MKYMEILGKSFLMVIEPLDFDIEQQKVFYPEFGFVIATESGFFRDSIAAFCKKYHNVRRSAFTPKIITSIRMRMKDFDRNSIRTERGFLELVALFFDIAYYTAVSHDKDAHVRKFSAFNDKSLNYYYYLGSRNYNSLQLLEKMEDKCEHSKIRHGIGSYFEISQVFN